MPSEPVETMILKPVSASLRRELQEKFDLAKRVLDEPVPRGATFGRAFLLLAECVYRDLGNAIYVTAYLQQLRRERLSKPAGWLSWFGGAPRFPSAPTGGLPEGEMIWKSLLEAALAKGPGEALQRVAEVALRVGCEQSGMRLLMEGIQLQPDCVGLRWLLAKTLIYQGEFDVATEQLTSIVKLAPENTVAKALLLAVQIEDLPKELASAGELEVSEEVNRVNAWILAGKLATARVRLGALRLQYGANLEVQACQEELLLATYRREMQRGEAASRVLREAGEPRAEELIRRLEAEFNRQEMAVFHARSKRHSAAPSWKLELAIRLKRAGNFSEAIATAEEVLLAKGADGLEWDTRAKEFQIQAGTLIGECWQHLRQFDRAWGYFQAAGDLAMETGQLNEADCLALYRAGVLGTSLGAKEKAEKYLAAIVVRPGGYRDAAAWLDKARQI
ncbi:MAG: hypothetical protein ACO1RA_18220 [Planctomycetaceae bacterium]